MKRKNIFKILFFITIPLILLGATGFVIIISQGASVTNQGIVSNMGVLKINTDPANIQFKVIIDGNSVNLQTTNGLNVEQGQHLLRIEAIGMIPWEKTININRDVVTDIFAKLFPSSMAITQITKTNIDKAFFSNIGDYVFYAIKNSDVVGEKGIWKMQLSANNIFFQNNAYNPIKIIDLNTSISPIISTTTYTITPSPDNNKILIFDNVSKQAMVITSQILNQQPVIIDLVSKLGFYPEYIHWFNNSNSILIKDQHALFEYNLSNNVLTLIKYSPITPIIFSANNDQAVYFDTTNKTLNIYKNQTSTVININNAIIPQDIQEIFLPQQNDRYFTIQTSINFELIDLEKSTIKNLTTTDNSLFLQSPDGLAYILKEKDNTYDTFTITENIGLNILETKTTKLDITADTHEIIKYTPQSNFLLYLNDKEGKVYVFNRDGSNKTALVSSNNIKSDFDFDNTATNLVLLLQDETQKSTDNTVNPGTNLYKLNLVKANP